MLHSELEIAADYEQMQEMLFGEKPSFEDIIEALIDLEGQLRTLAEKHE